MSKSNCNTCKNNQLPQFEKKVFLIGVTTILFSLYGVFKFVQLVIDFF